MVYFLCGNCGKCSGICVGGTHLLFCEISINVKLNGRILIEETLTLVELEMNEACFGVGRNIELFC